MIAREAGLEPLADTLLADPTQDPTTVAAGYVNEQVADAAAALEGARAILVERFAEDADLIGGLRERMWTRGRLVTKVRDGQGDRGREVRRLLRLRRAVHQAALAPDPGGVPRGEGGGARRRPGAGRRRRPGAGRVTDYERTIAARVRHRRPRAARPTRWLAEAVRWAWRTRILLHLGIDIRVRLRTVAEEGAIGVFATNLRDLLLAAPAGSRATMGLDPGLRTGVKVAVVDATGKVVATDTIYPHEPRRAWDAALATLTKLAVAHDVELVAIGNGTASRETDKLARELAARNPALKLTTVMVSEAGASVYSASAYASAELPGLDVVAARRGLDRPPAAGPARRAGEDRPEVDRRRPVPARPGRVGAVPLAGRGGRGLRERGRRRRQHRVGAAAAPGLRDHRGAGRRRSWRTATRNGPFRTRTALADVPRLGPKAFEQCAGFLRIRGGDDPLDVSGVHPEAYPVVRRILARGQDATSRR